MDLCLTNVAIPAPALLGVGRDQALIEVVVDCRGHAVQLARLPNASGSGGEVLFKLRIAQGLSSNPVGQ